MSIDASILRLAQTLRLAESGHNHTGWSGHSQRPYRVSDQDGTPEYAVSATVAECIRRAAAVVAPAQELGR